MLHTLQIWLIFWGGGATTFLPPFLLLLLLLSLLDFFSAFSNWRAILDGSLDRTWIFLLRYSSPPFSFSLNSSYHRKIRAYMLRCKKRADDDSQFAQGDGTFCDAFYGAFSCPRRYCLGVHLHQPPGKTMQQLSVSEEANNQA